MTEHPTSRARQLVVGTVTSIAVAIATIALLEGVASAYLFARDLRSNTAPRTLYRPHTVHDTLLGWVNTPNTTSQNEFGPGISFNTDAQGFRASRASRQADSAARMTLVCSGDSYTVGLGVRDDDSWCALLQRRFSAVRSLDMGQAEYGLDQSYLWYRRDGLRTPRQVHLFTLTEPQFERSVGDDVGGRFKPYMSVQAGQLAVHGVPVQPQSSGSLQQAGSSRLVEDLRVVQLARKVPAFDRARKLDRAEDERVPLFETIIQELAGVHQRQGSQLVVVYLPTQVSQKSIHGDDRRMRLSAFARRRGIRFVDLTPGFRALSADSSDLFFFSRSSPGVSSSLYGQYSAFGHAWIARTIGDSLATLPELVIARATDK